MIPQELEEERQSAEESAGGRIQQVSVELSHAREEVLAKDAELQHLREEFNKSLEHSNVRFICTCYWLPGYYYYYYFC